MYLFMKSDRRRETVKIIAVKYSKEELKRAISGYLGKQEEQIAKILEDNAAGINIESTSELEHLLLSSVNKLRENSSEFLSIGYDYTHTLAVVHVHDDYENVEGMLAIEF